MDCGSSCIIHVVHEEKKLIHHLIEKKIKPQHTVVIQSCNIHLKVNFEERKKMSSVI